MSDTELTNLQQKIRCVSHEIRNHLSICDMYSQIVKKNLEKIGVENPSIDNALDCIKQSIQIIESNLLDLKSLNQNSEKVVDFKSVVERGVELSKAYVVDKEIDISCFAKNTAEIKVDVERFLAVIVNIIKNGIEAIEIKGQVEILAEVKVGVGVIKISNDGKSIPKNKQEKIFEKDYTTKQNGCGLGLAICREYLEKQNGTLSLVRSVKNKTTFEITIPVFSA